MLVLAELVSAMAVDTSVPLSLAGHAGDREHMVCLGLRRKDLPQLRHMDLRTDLLLLAVHCMMEPNSTGTTLRKGHLLQLQRLAASPNSLVDTV